MWGSAGLALAAGADYASREGVPVRYPVALRGRVPDSMRFTDQKHRPSLDCVTLLVTCLLTETNVSARHAQLSANYAALVLAGEPLGSFSNVETLCRIFDTPESSPGLGDVYLLPTYCQRWSSTRGHAWVAQWLLSGRVRVIQARRYGPWVTEMDLPTYRYEYIHHTVRACPLIGDLTWHPRNLLTSGQ